jgi:hypothetical protein
MEKVLTSLGMILGSLLLVALAACILALPVQYLWNNCLVPAVDGTHQIGFLQALGLNILFSILFKASVSSNKEK